MSYEGFSRQDLKDRLGSLESELEDLDDQRWKVIGEIIKIGKLLEGPTDD